MHVVFFRILKLFFITGFLLQYLGNWYRTNGPLVIFIIFNTSNKNKAGDINSPWNLLVDSDVSAVLPLTSRLRKSQTSYPSNLEVPQENLGSPTFFHAATVCPLFSRTWVLISVSHRIIMIYTSVRSVCFKKSPYRLLKFDRIFLESLYLYVGP